jgi:hypothetical protein
MREWKLEAGSSMPGHQRWWYLYSPDGRVMLRTQDEARGREVVAALNRPTGGP